MARKGRRRRRTRRRPVGLGGVILFFALALAGTAAVWLAVRGGLPSPRTAPVPRGAAAPPPRAAAPAPTVHRTSEPEEPPPGDAAVAAPPPAPHAPPGGARVALVIDDLGRSVADVDRFEALGVPLTYAVLPFERLTPEVTAALAGQGAEFLLHLPMQGRPGADPGPGALTDAMDRRDLAGATRAALAAVPGAVGVNNHMGSVLTADPAAMRAVLGVVGARGLFFLDSRTSAATVAYRTATELGVPAAERQVFLDPDPRPEAVRGEFRRLLALAHDDGAAIAIGHPHPATLEVLRSEVPAARSLGYRFVPVSDLVDRPAPRPEG